MKSIIKFVLIFSIVFTSCNKVVNKGKEALNKGGEAVGETATEFFEGVTEGVDKTLECKIILSDSLTNRGVKTGTFSIDNSNSGGVNNLLVIYLIFDKDIKSNVMAKAFDKKGLEVGRSKINIEGFSGDAGYFEFEFDKRTDIGVRNKIIIE